MRAKLFSEASRMLSANRGTWPKVLPVLSDEQQRIREDFMHYWHEVLPQRYGVVEQFNHRYPLRSRPLNTDCRTLEIGAGLGEHIAYENLDGQDYHCVELREELARHIRERFPTVTAKVGDCQGRIDYPDGHFDRILAVHVLEHLPNLPSALAELARLLKPDGIFSVVIPCDPGLAYGLARRISAQRIFEKRYGCSYDWFVRSEHINAPGEITAELSAAGFTVVHRRYFPLLLPVAPLNLCLGLTLRLGRPEQLR